MGGRAARITLGVIGAGLVLAAPASAGIPGPTESLGSAGSYEYYKATFANVASQAGAPAECEPGLNVTGGGGSVSGKPSGGALNRTSPTTIDGDSWTAEGRALGGGTRTVTTFAICSPMANSFSNGTSIADPGAVLTLTDSCGPGQELLGFGIHGGGGDIRLLESSLSGTSDITSIGQNVGNTAGTLTEWYSCQDNYVAAVRIDQSFVPGHESGKSTARCKSDEAVIFGGFASSAKGDPARKTWVTSTRPFESKDSNKVPEDGWTVKAQNNRKGRVLLSAEAVCAPLL
jgi:hypothetical protein